MTTDRSGRQSERGVALLIALLVTTLLMAIVVEFAYGTRVSLRAAVNFRDSQRAYYLARSGVSFAGMLLAENLRNGKPRDNLEQREWQVVPIVSGGDRELRVRWEDEGGKINIGPSNFATNENWFRELLTQTGVNQEVVNRIKDAKMKIYLVEDLHQIMSDEEYGKLRDFVTTLSDGKIDVNTASETVLKSVLVGKTTTPDTLVTSRKDKPMTVLPTDINQTPYATTSDHFKIQSYATVGGYTKQAEAVILRDKTKYTTLYWRLW